MKHPLPLPLLLLFWLLIALTGCGKSKPQLNLFIWSEFIDPKIIAEFERRFDCRVIVDYFEDPDSMIAKLVAGGSSTYDIVIPSDTTLPLMIRRGLLAPLRHNLIPNLKNLDPRFTNAPFDPGNQYSVPLGWGTTGIYLRNGPTLSPEESWSLLFDPAKQLGPFMLIDDARACIGAALRYRGHSLNSVNPEQLSEARDLLIETKKRSLGFEGGTGCKNRVLARGASLAMAYSGDAARGSLEDPATTYVLPREGTQIFVDTLSIPSNAPHPELAEQFINYMLEPKVGAQFSESGSGATANRAALQLLKPSVLQNPSIYPPQEFMNRLEYATDLGEHNRLYDELWTQIKSK